MSGEERILIELNPRERRLYDRLRARVVKPELAATSGVRDLLLLMPDLTVLLFRLMRDDRVPMGSKAIAFLGLAYVFSPIDLIPEIFLGPLGLLDDILVVGLALSQLVNHVHPDIVRSHWSGHGDALNAIQRVVAFIESNLKTPLRSAMKWLGA
ncbi:MAG: YkvA family protein [Proteobacteria bacterium]|nr:YkvA family protein [Pseudomonadota bacterium]